jgi:hypothetical protein
MKPIYAHYFRRRDNVFVAIVLLCLIPYTKSQLVICRRGESNRRWRIRARFLLLIARIDFRPGETAKRVPRRGFGETAQVARTIAVGSSRNGEPLSVSAKVVPYVRYNTHGKCVYEIYYPGICVLLPDGSATKTPAPSSPGLHLLHPHSPVCRVRQATVLDHRNRRNRRSMANEESKFQSHNKNSARRNMAAYSASAARIA